MATIPALYCHIPFCHTICPFCAFAVHGNRAGLQRPYLDALKGEIARTAGEFQAASQTVTSLYIGGGTPSTLSLASVDELLAWIASLFHFAADIEIAFEVNPEDASAAYLEGLCRAGVTRVSIGLQSLDAATLTALHRNHDVRQGEDALASVSAAGPANYNADLMFGIPEAPPGAFRRDLERVAALRPPHISLYGLDVEPGTLFSRDPGVNAWMAGHEESQAEQYVMASDYLVSQGYRHYEISNFCLPGHEGRQNLLVWDGGNYLGFGTGAHSHVEGTRWQNHRHLRAYLRDIAAGAAPTAARETLSVTQQANEAMMLALRREEGLDVRTWERRFSRPWGAGRERIARQLQSEGKALWDGATLALTTRGFLLADAVTAQLMEP
jgi:oxygen-independent coproporphyrinogen-3 oxidase